MKNNIIIKLDRDSVCMGDDCFSHAEAREYDENVTIAYVLEEITHYVPNMHNVVWTISSPDKLIGFIITDN